MEPLTLAVLEDYLVALAEPEVTRLVVDYALGTCGLHRVSLGVYDFNPRAQRVYEKCGFRHEGRLRQALRWDGQWHDELHGHLGQRPPAGQLMRPSTRYLGASWPTARATGRLRSQQARRPS